MLRNYRSLTPVQKRNLKLAVLVLVLFFFLCSVLFTGERVTGISRIDPGCTVTVLHQTDISDEGTLYTLTGDQILSLRRELFDGLYLRSANKVFYGATNETDRYHITIIWPDGDTPDLSILLFGRRWMQAENTAGYRMNFKVLTLELFDRLPAILQG